MERLLGRLLLVSGLLIAAAGVLLLMVDRIPWLGRLPGDLRLTRDGVSVYVPLVTCLLLSLLLTVFLNLVGRR